MRGTITTGPHAAAAAGRKNSPIENPATKENSMSKAALTTKVVLGQGRSPRVNGVSAIASGRIAAASPPQPALAQNVVDATVSTIGAIRPATSATWTD